MEKLGACALACALAFLVLNHVWWLTEPAFAASTGVRTPPPAAMASAAPAAPVIASSVSAASCHVRGVGCCILAAAAAAAVGARARARRAESKMPVKDAEVEVPYGFQKTVLPDFDYLNDVGYLPDGTPLNKAGNAINHPERIGPDRHMSGSPLPRAVFVNSVGYLPDGTAMNRAGNAINHPERIMPDVHTSGSPLPASKYKADLGYLADGTPLATAGNNSFKRPSPVEAMTARPNDLAGSTEQVQPEQAHHGIKFEYSFQKDAYADYEFSNDVGYLPDGTPLNKAGNAMNHPERIQPDPHTPGSPLPRALFTNSVGYLPDGTALNAAGNAINHPERMQPDLHTAGSPLPASKYAADVGYLVDGTPLDAAGNNSLKGVDATSLSSSASAAALVGSVAPQASDVRHGGGFEFSFPRNAYADFLFCNDVGYLPDGTAMNRAGNAVNHPERAPPDPHAPGSPLPRAHFVNDVGYLPDGTALNLAGNAVNHPEAIQPDVHISGSPLPPSAYAADIGYLVDGTAMDAAGNNSLR